MTSVTERCERDFVDRTGANTAVPPVAILLGAHSRHTRARIVSKVLSPVWLTDSTRETDLVPVLSVATLRSTPKKRQHTVP